jgi:hypothetical protein
MLNKQEIEERLAGFEKDIRELSKDYNPIVKPALIRERNHIRAMTNLPLTPNTNFKGLVGEFFWGELCGYYPDVSEKDGDGGIDGSYPFISEIDGKREIIWRTVDVKICSVPYNGQRVIPVKVGSTKSDLYVGVWIDWRSKEVSFLGWTNKSRVLASPKGSYPGKSHINYMVSDYDADLFALTSKVYNLENMKKHPPRIG